MQISVHLFDIFVNLFVNRPFRRLFTGRLDFAIRHVSNPYQSDPASRRTSSGIDMAPSFIDRTSI
jgi:hypothetical protein